MAFVIFTKDVQDKYFPPTRLRDMSLSPPSLTSPSWSPTELNEMPELLNFPSPPRASPLRFTQTQNSESFIEPTECVLPLPEELWLYGPLMPNVTVADAQLVGFPQVNVEDQYVQQGYGCQQVYPVESTPASSYLTAPSMPFPTPCINGYVNKQYSPIPAIPAIPATPNSPEYLSPYFDQTGNLSSTPTTPLIMQPKPCSEQAVASRSNQNKKQLTYQDQVTFWKNARELPSAAGNPVFIPQRIYKPHTTSDIKRYVEEVSLDLPIIFWMEGPEECGISLIDALHGRTKRLRDREKEVFEGRGPSVSIRLEWPGYRQWSRQIPTKDFKSPPRPINMAKLCKNVAKCVQRFISERQHCELEDGAELKWRVGGSGIRLEDLVLVSLHHVSMGSWQPQLRLRARIK